MDIESTKRLVELMGENGGVIAPPSYFTQVPDMFTRRTDLSMQEKMLFIYIWGYAANKGHAFPTQSRMLKELGITKPTLNKILNSLEAKGGIYVVNQFIGNTSVRTANLYFLSVVDMKTGEFDNEYLDMQKKLYPDKQRILKGYK